MFTPWLAAQLAESGFDTVHVRELGLQAASDSEILEKAASDGRALISADTDFANLLTLRHQKKPTVILLRRVPRRREQLLTLLVANLPLLESDIESGSIIVLEASRIRIRRLPIGD